MAKGKVDFSNLTPLTDFDKKDVSSADKENNFKTSNVSDKYGSDVLVDNILEPKVHRGSLKKNKKVFYKYKAIFDKSLEEHKTVKKPALIYEYNMKRIQVLSQLNPDVNLTEIINYIINDFFSVNSEEIKVENKIYMSEINDTF